MDKLGYWLGDILLSFASFVGGIGWRLLYGADNFDDDYGDGDFDDDTGTCLTCGGPLQIVRPGKRQCPNQGVDGHD